MPSISKGRRSPGKLRALGDHDEFLNRITKSLYYSRFPRTDCLSLPVTEFAAELFTEIRNGCTLERLDVEEASRISRNACVSPCSFVLALLYLERLKDCNPEYLYKVAPSELFLVSLMIASKYLNDDGEEDEVFNTEWAKSGNISVPEINELERNFLNAINWSIYVYENDFWKRLKKLEKIIAQNEAKKRGWYSYYELSCLIDTIRLTALLETLVSLSSVCIATYAAGIVTLLGSALVASHVPGTSLAPKLPLNQQSQQPQQFTPPINTTEIHELNRRINPEYYSIDFTNSLLDLNSSRTPTFKTTTDKCQYNCWIDSFTDWLPGYFDYLIVNYLNTESSFDDMNVGLNRNTGLFITDSQSTGDDRAEGGKVWDELVTEINWKDTLNEEFHCDKKNWRYYATYVAVSLGHQH